MAPPQQITNSFRATEKYKELHRMVTEMEPGLPELLKDYVIAIHLSNPTAYRKYAGVPIPTPAPPAEAVITGAISIEEAAAENVSAIVTEQAQ